MEGKEYTEFATLGSEPEKERISAKKEKSRPMVGKGEGLTTSEGPNPVQRIGHRRGYSKAAVNAEKSSASGGDPTEIVHCWKEKFTRT